MAALGIVPFSTAMTSSNNKIQLTQHSRNSVHNVNTSVSPERREILILRKRHKPVTTENNIYACDTTAVTTASTTILVANNCSSVNSANRIRKKPPVVQRSHQQPPPVSVARRNARERNRVKQVNNGFATLRQHIPLSVSSSYSSETSGNRSNKKLSKVETLRMAVDYIRGLQQLLSMDDNESVTSQSPNSSDGPSPTSPSSPGNLSVIPSTSDFQPRYGHYEEEIVKTECPRSPVLNEDEDDSSFLGTSSPSPSSTTHYSRMRGVNNIIKLSSQADVVPGTDTVGAFHYQASENFAPLSLTSNSFTMMSKVEECMTPQEQLEAHPLMSSAYQQSPSDELVILSRESSSVIQPLPTSSLSPGNYSEQSLSPKATNVHDILLLRTATTSSYLPPFSSTLKPTLSLTLQNNNSQSSLGLLPTSAVSTSSVIQHNYSPNIGLLSHVKTEGSEQVNGGDVIDMMSWWEHDQRFRLVTSAADSATSSAS